VTHRDINAERYTHKRRTTMWRAVKRLERQGIIEITKKDLQNLVKLKKELEEEE